MNKHLGWAVRMLIAVLGIAFILYNVNWSTRIVLPDGSKVPVTSIDGHWVTPGEPLDGVGGLEVIEGRVERASLETAEQGVAKLEPSFAQVIKESRWPLLLAGLGVFVPVFFVGALRWMVLMRARGIDAGYGRALRLTMAGQFFNLCMPGSTGGDVMKAYYVTRGTHRRADAVVSIAVDRVCGLVGLILLVGIVGLASLDDPLIRKLTIAMWIGLSCLVTAAALYGSRLVRARLRLGALVGKAPGAGLLRRLDALIAAYRNHLGALAGAIALSLPMHLGLAVAMSLAGYAIGVDQPLLYLLGTVPVVLLLWALPVSGPLGLGPLDYVAVQLIISGSETTVQQALIMFVAYRLFAVALGLAGATALFGSDAPSAKALKEQQADEAVEQPPS